MFYYTCADFDIEFARGCEEEISSAAGKEELAKHFSGHKKFTLQVEGKEKKCMVSYCDGFPIEKVTPELLEKKVTADM
ncbi:MAG: hypothetical protein KAW12_06710 [Candidatus Aminicenantes bacterium]|nr:hypothetical protein [Candidatus Aminicenantes bacterium]